MRAKSVYKCTSTFSVPRVARIRGGLSFKPGYSIRRYRGVGPASELAACSCEDVLLPSALRTTRMPPPMRNPGGRADVAGGDDDLTWPCLEAVEVGTAGTVFLARPDKAIRATSYCQSLVYK